MDQSQIYVTISIITFAVIAAVVVFIAKKGRESGLTKFAALSFLFIISGIIFGGDRRVGYSLIGVGVFFAIIDMINKFKSNKYN